MERWACDSSLTRVLLQDSVVIDVSRAEPTIRGPKRRALNARDRHCQWPGCERTASNCDGHHLVYVMHGGSDELENLILLCTRHHRMVHEAGWQLVKTESGEIVTIAPTVTFGLPRGPD
ncbi:MAG: HNH endonuclease [Chloroflexi bacterium]|nr:MAG: HNH endonuclease [Chloroflexota bacterium]